MTNMKEKLTQTIKMKIVAEKSAVPAKVLDFDLMVLSTLRYALKAHSYMVGVGRDVVLAHWNHPQVKMRHWCIFRDIRKHIDDSIRLFDVEETDSDLRLWARLYSDLAMYEGHIEQPLTIKEIVSRTDYDERDREDALLKCFQ